MSLYGLSVKFSRKLDSAQALEVYHAWCREERPANKGVVDFKDVCLQLKVSSAGNSWVQGDKPPSKYCYLHIPVRLTFKPSDDAVRRLRRVRCTGFAGQAYGRNAAMATE